MREMVEIFPFKLRKLWNNLELRILVLLSLVLQIVLIVTGNRRKYRKNKWIAAIIWLCYLSADAVATIALGVLSQSQGDSKSSPDPLYTIMAFWAPFLLMHLGGPDTITAYALADNELRGRHLLGLLSQVSVAFFVVFLRSWISTPLNYIRLVIFVAGLIEYGERTWVLILASRDQFRESLVSQPDPGPNYAKFMHEWVSKEAEGYKVSLGDDFVDGNKVDDVESSSTPVHAMVSDAHTEEGTVGDGDAAFVLQKAYYFFGTFKRLFADLILSFQDRKDSLSFFQDRSTNWCKAFRIVEVELGFMYDLFYTKALLLYSPTGCFFRFVSCILTIAALLVFKIIDKGIYHKTEVIITYCLLVGAILLEIYAVMILVLSDRMGIWLNEDWPTIPLLRNIVLRIRRFVSLLRYLHLVPSEKRWSNAMGQYNVLKFCLKNKRKFKCVAFILEYLEKYLFLRSVIIPDGLKGLIFEELKARAGPADKMGVTHNERDKELGSYRGDKILLKEMKCFEKSNDEVEFDQRFFSGTWQQISATTPK